MSASRECLYIKGDNNVEVTSSTVTLGDVVEMECADPTVLQNLKPMKLLKFQSSGGKSRTVVSILRVIQCIHERYPGIRIENMGPSDIIVTFEDQKTPNQMIHWGKIIGVVLISFFGAAFSIMSFNNDVDTPKLFAQIYRWVTGTSSDGFTLLEVSYSVGIVIGILLFFNHFGKKRFSVDPTPIEVEMRLYENDIQDTLIDTYSRKGQEIDVNTTNIVRNHRS